MARPNYSFEKRQRELAKKKKKEEKRARKAGLTEDQTGSEQETSPDAPTRETQPPSSGGDEKAV
jgi:hypothetical protein